MTEPLYSGEAICKRWGDSSSGGRTVTLQLEADGDHPFRGYEGERFAVVFVPIGNDEKPMKKELMGDASTRKDEVEGRSTPAATDSAVSSPTKPKKRWHEMPASQRAALLINDDDFQRFAEKMGASLGGGELVRQPDRTDNWLKGQCCVHSKSELRPGSSHHAKYLEIEGNFQAWRQARQLGAA